MEISECITIVKDIVVALSALATVSLAYIGLDKWKKELKGKAHFDTAKDLIKAVYKFRDHMSYTRNAFLTAAEFPKDYDPYKKDAKNKGDAHVYIYQNRMKPLIEAGQDLDLHTLEAEALWGEDIKKKSNKLRSTFFRVQNSIKTSIKDIYSGRENLKTETELKKKIESDIYESPKKDDELSIEISNAIKEIEEKVRPYLDKNL